MKIQEVAKKLALWHTPTFKPIMSHDDLEPILFSVGFISLPTYASLPSTTLKQTSSPPSIPSADVQWKEYAFPSSSVAAVVSGILPPRPRLPFPMIYGLHLIAYRAFLSALECYIDTTDVYNLFHVRAMPITPLPDEDFEKTYRPMKDSEINDMGLFVYRGGTIYRCMFEQIAAMERRAESNEEDNNDHRIKGRSRRTDQIIMVSLDNLLPERYMTSPCPSLDNAEY